MKKLSLFFIVFMFAGFWVYAQNAEYVVKQEFQEKTKKLKAQVSSIQKTNSSLYKDVASLAISIEGLQTKVTQIETEATSNTDSIKAYKAIVGKTTAELDDSKKKCNQLTIIAIIIFILALGFIISIKNKLTKKIVEVKKQLDETNSMLIEQGKSTDKKINLLTDALAKSNDAIQKISSK